MTNELEKQFFDAFGIEPKLKYYCPSCNTELEKCLDSEGIYYRCGNHLECDYFLDVQSEDFEECLNCLSFKLAHPQITSDILLELICIISSNPISVLFEPMLGEFKEVELLKKSILLTCIANEDVIKHQVRTLFEER